MPSRPWLPKVRHLLGEIPDHDVARRAGTVQSVVTVARRRLGIPSYRSRTLASYPPREVLRLVRARSNRGESMRGAPLNDWRLANLCRFHFGGWYQAVEAAGLKPEGKPIRRRKAPSKAQRRPLTPALLRGPKSSAELEHLTGVAKYTVRYRRELLGIVRDARRGPNRSWLPAARRLLGKIPDTEIARRAGVSAGIVSAARRGLRIECAPVRSMATSGEIRERLRGMSKHMLRRFLAGLDRIDAKIVEGRYLRARPVTLAQLGASLGISRQRVAQRERRAHHALTCGAPSFLCDDSRDHHSISS